MLSAFGIRCGEARETNGNSRTDDSPSVGSIVQGLREEQNEEWDTASPYDDQVVVGYEQGTAVPYLMNQQGLEMLTSRKYEIPGSDPYRLQGLPDGKKAGERCTKNDSWVEYQAPESSMCRPEVMPQHPQTSQETIEVYMVAQDGLRDVCPPSESNPRERASTLTRDQCSRRNVQTKPKQSVQYVEPAQQMDADTLARLEGHECFSPEIPYQDDWTHVDGPRRVPVSKFSPYDSDSPAHRAGVFRSMSTRVKGALRRPSIIKKKTVSKPSNFHDFDPRHADHHVVHPEVKAVPIEQVQQKHRRVSQPGHAEISAPLNFKRGSGDPGYTTYPETWATPITNPVPELRHQRGQVTRLKEVDWQYPHALKSKPSKSNKGSQRKPALQPQEPVKPRKVKVVGDADRDTLFGDFIDFQDSSSGEEVVVRKSPDDDEYSILDIRPLRPQRKPSASRKVDTSRYSWMPPGPPRLPTPANVTSQKDWRMSREYPTVDDLFDEIDHQIADANIPEQEKPVVNREAHRLNRVLDRPPPGAYAVDEDDAEPEVVIDTFGHGSHASWVATKRPDPNTAHSDHRRFQQQAYDNSANEDEARVLMERLRRVRHGDNV